MIVLDTCAIIWDALSPHLLSARAKKAIAAANESDGIVFCEISLWEIAMLMKKRRLVIETDYSSFINAVMASNHYLLKGITAKIADMAVNLPEEVTADPADRLIIATAVVENAPLVTGDTNIRSFSQLQTIW